MNYKEIVEQVLRNRKEIVCVEASLLEDFTGTDTQTEFAGWCKTNNIGCSKVEGSVPQKIVLTKLHSPHYTFSDRTKKNAFVEEGDNYALET